MTHEYVADNSTIQKRFDENDNTVIIVKVLLLSFPSIVILQSLKVVLLWTTFELLFSKQLNNGQISVLISSC